MKALAFVLALVLQPGPPGHEVARIGFYDSREACRAQALSVVRELRKRNPDWRTVMFRCRPKRYDDHRVTSWEAFLPAA